jgi:hypothetical protein
MKIPLPRVPSVLLKRKYTDKPVNYKRLYAAAVEQRIAATQAENGRWEVDDDDGNLQQIVEIVCARVAA